MCLCCWFLISLAALVLTGLACVAPFGWRVVAAQWDLWRTLEGFRRSDGSYFGGV